MKIISNKHLFFIFILSSFFLPKNLFCQNNKFSGSLDKIAPDFEVGKFINEENITNAKNNTISNASLLTDFAIVEASEYIKSKIKNKRIVLINENHDNPSHRTFIGNILEIFYSQNFRHLAVEALSSDKIQEISYRDPSFIQYLDYAKKMGLKLYNYDNLGNEKSLFQPIVISDLGIDANIISDMNDRDYNQFLKIDSILMSLPAYEKILIHVGLGHNKLKSSSLWKPLGEYLSEKYKDQVLSIDQNFKNEGNQFSAIVSEYPSYVLVNNNIPLAHEEFDPFLNKNLEIFDFSIIHNDSKKIEPNFLKYKTDFDHGKYNINYPALIIVFRCKDDPQKDIPFFIKLIRDRNSLIEYLSNEKSNQIFIKDINNEINFYNSNCEK